MNNSSLTENENQTNEANQEHKISFWSQLREGYFGLFVFLFFLFFFSFWIKFVFPFFKIDYFNEILIFIASLIVPTYLSIILSFKIFGENKEYIPKEETINITDVYSHQPEKVTFVIFTLVPLILTFWEDLGIILLVSYYVFIVNKMRKQSRAERQTLIIRIIAIISIWLSTVLFIFE